MISAIFERKHNIDTKSWWLGSEISYIEIDATIDLTAEQITRVENICNDSIAASTPVSVITLSDKSDISPEVLLSIESLYLNITK